MQNGNLVHLLIKVPRTSEVTAEATQTFLSTLTNVNSISKIDRIFGRFPKSLSLEIVLMGSQIYFVISCDPSFEQFIRTQIQSNYPLSVIEKIKDPLENIQFDYIKFGLSKGTYYPLFTYRDFKDGDPMSALLSVLTKGGEQEFAMIQLALETTHNSWQSSGLSYAEKGQKKDDGTWGTRSDASVIKEKLMYPGFTVSLRVLGNNPNTLQELSSALSVVSRSDGNSLFPKKLGLLVNKAKALELVRARKVVDGIILNIAETATLWHIPNDKIKVPGVAWGKTVLSEPPENLPIASEMSDEEKLKVNFFAKTPFHNKESIFGIKNPDRLRHIWAIGKTGSGKSTLLENMAIDDMRKGRGVAYLDPHGDSAEALLNYVPSDRINDTIYFNPADRDFPISMNPLEVTNREEAELVVAGLMSIFTKIWANVWSARMEYILRNTFLTLAEVPDTTLEDVLRMLSNQSFRNKIVAKINDQALINFWQEEFDKMPQELQKEAIAPIQNKVGQFVTSPTIRRIISIPKSTVSIDEVMNGQKIFIANLSQGRLGEDNAALLGAMLITKFQLAAMRRVDKSKEERIPFYLYVDEFQNFATDSFIKILSEARKFGLGLTLANQYMAQIPPHIQKAILGNAGTIVSFAIGAEDAAITYKELAEVFTANDLVNLQNHQIAIKLMIDGHTSRPFFAQTLPPPASTNQNKEKIIRVSRERYARKITEGAIKHEFDTAEKLGQMTTSSAILNNEASQRNPLPLEHTSVANEDVNKSGHSDLPSPSEIPDQVQNADSTDRSSFENNELPDRTIYESMERKEK